MVQFTDVIAAPKLLSTIMSSNTIVRKWWTALSRIVPKCIFLPFDNILSVLHYKTWTCWGNILCFVSKKQGCDDVQKLANNFPVTPHAAMCQKLTSIKLILLALMSWEMGSQSLTKYEVESIFRLGNINTRTWVINMHLTPGSHFLI